MSLFNKSSDDMDKITEEIKKVENEAITSIIDKNMTVIGEIHFSGKARIDGMIEGNLRGEHLILSETGKIQGDIQVTSFNCYGAVKGDVKAEILSARKDCKISGKLSAKALSVEPGACIEGDIKSGAASQTKERLLPEGNIPATTSSSHKSQ